jgi:Transcriptional regulator, AbiEi antitoxin
MRVESPNHRDRVVGGLADGQHGVVSREQLLAAGVGRGAIVRALDAGRLRMVFRGVYAVGHVALRREGWWMAALLACGQGAALSHRTAATVWGLTTGPALPIDVTTSTDHGRKHRQITTHRGRLAPLDALTRDKLRVTTPSRTIVDLAATLEGRALREVVERAQDIRRFDPEDIRATLARAPRRPGSQRLLDLIRVMAPDDDNARSHLERLFVALTRNAGLPRPLPNHEIAGRLRDSRGRTSASSSRPMGTATTPRAKPSAATAAATGNSPHWAGGRSGSPTRRSRSSPASSAPRWRSC